MKIKREKAVEKEVLSICSQIGLDMSVVESKRFSANGIYKPSETEAGFSDLVGNTQDGIAVFIELKAPGKLKTLKPHQKRFLMRKIDRGCFATCVDSGDMFFKIYIEWKNTGIGVLREHLLNL